MFDIPIEPLETRTLLSAFAAHINFQPPQLKPPRGYLADAGAAFHRNHGLHLGWSSPNPTGTATQGRSLADPLRDTSESFLAGKKRLTWEISVPNGTYAVHLIVGGPDKTPLTYQIRAGNTTLLAGQTSRKVPWLETTTTVSITDGLLKICDARNATGTRIDEIDIVPAALRQLTLEAEQAPVSSGIEQNGATITSLDSNDFIAFHDINLARGFNSVQFRLGTSSANDRQTIELRADSPTGTLLGTLQTQGFGPVESFTTQSAAISIPPQLGGRHDLYAVFKGGGAVGDLDWLRLSSRHFFTIMPIGDSITEGKGGHDTYRRPLWHMLEDGGYSVDFVGTHRGLVQYSIFNQTEWDWDQDHEGHTGYTTTDVLDHMDEWFSQEALPDIVLLHIGSNNMIMHSIGADQTATEVGQIIDKLRQYKPDIKVLLAQAIPSTRTADQTMWWYAQLIAQLAAAKDTEQSPVILIDQFDGFDAATETYDGMHPTPEGELKMAGKWFAGLAPLLDG